MTERGRATMTEVWQALPHFRGHIFDRGDMAEYLGKPVEDRVLSALQRQGYLLCIGKQRIGCHTNGQRQFVLTERVP